MSACEVVPRAGENEQRREKNRQHDRNSLSKLERVGESSSIKYKGQESIHIFNMYPYHYARCERNDACDHVVQKVCCVIHTRVGIARKITGVRPTCISCEALSVY